MATLQASTRQGAFLRHDRTSRSLDRLRWHAPALVLAVVGGVVAVGVHLAWFPSLSGNADEAAYLLQGEALRHGSLTIPVVEKTPAGLRSPVGFLQPWLTGERDGSWFTKYLPGYPALLAASSLLFGTPVGALAVGAATWLLGTYAFASVLFESRATALTAAVLVSLSPLFVVQGALYLSYAFSAGLLFAGAAAVLRGARCQAACAARCPGGGEHRCRRWTWLLLGGGLWGCGLLVRPYDMALVALPVLGYALVRWGRRWRHGLRILAGVALGAAPFLVALLAYDQRVTGHALLMPLGATDPLDAMGFGTRRIMPTETPKEFTVEMARSALEGYLRTVPDWVFAGAALLLAALLGLLAGRRRLGSRLLLVAVVVVVPLGYFPFWGMVISSDLLLADMGPVYYLPALTALAIAAAYGICTVISVVRRHVPALARGPLALAVVAVLVAGFGLSVSLPDLRAALERQRIGTAQAEAVASAVPSLGSLRTPAAVVVTTPAQQPYVGASYQFLRNPYLGAPGEDPSGHVAGEHPLLYAASHGPQDVLLDQALPGRALYGLRIPTASPGDGPRPSVPSFVPLTTVSGDALRVDVTATPAVADACVVAFVIVGSVRRAQPLRCGGTPGGSSRAAWELTSAQIRSAVADSVEGAERASESTAATTSWLVAGFATSPVPMPTTASEQSSWWATTRIVEQRSSLAAAPVDDGPASSARAPVTVLTPGVDWVGEPQPGATGPAGGQRWTMPATSSELRVTVTAP